MRRKALRCRERGATVRWSRYRLMDRPALFPLFSFSFAISTHGSSLSRVLRHLPVLLLLVLYPARARSTAPIPTPTLLQHISFCYFWYSSFFAPHSYIYIQTVEPHQPGSIKRKLLDSRLLSNSVPFPSYCLVTVITYRLLALWSFIHSFFILWLFFT